MGYKIKSFQQWAKTKKEETVAKEEVVVAKAISAPEIKSTIELVEKEIDEEQITRMQHLTCLKNSSTEQLCLDVKFGRLISTRGGSKCVSEMMKMMTVMSSARKAKRQSSLVPLRQKWQQLIVICPQTVAVKKRLCKPLKKKKKRKEEMRKKRVMILILMQS